MKKFIILLGLLLSCSITYRNPHNFHDSMGKIRIFQNSVPIAIGNGSAFVIAKNTLLTADHVCKIILDKRYYGDVEYFYKGSFRTSLIEMVAKRDTINDLCILKVNDIKLESFEIAETESLIGDRVYSYGCADGIFGFLSEGFVLDNSTKIDNKKVLVISAPGFFGQSGGPILNEYGEVIGVVSGGSNEFHHIQVSPQTKIIRNFIKEFINE